MSGSSRRNAVAVSLGWWYLRRLIRKRGSAAMAGLVAGEGLSFARRPRKRRPLRWLLLLGLAGGGGLLWWRRRGGGDDWGHWQPDQAPSPDPGGVVPEPEPEPEPVTVPKAAVRDPVAT